MSSKLTTLGLGILCLAAINCPLIASGDDHEHHGESDTALFLADQSARPDAASYRINNFDIDRVVDVLNGLPVTAGFSGGKETPQPAKATSGWFNYPSFYAEYDYIHSHDQRVNGADSETNSAVIGFDFVTINEILVGFTYSYSNRDADLSPLGLPDNEDSHFFSIYTAKTFGQWVSVGVTGGYGYTSNSIAGADAGNEDTWSLSPFVSVAHKWGPFSASLTASSIHTWVSSNDAPAGAGNADDDTGKFNLTAKLGYAFTEKLKVEAIAKYVDMEYYENTNPALPEDHNWFGFGGKATYRINDRFDVYLGYMYDAFNDSYKNHNVQTGFTYSW